jgi:hypothetical protein
MLEAEEKLRNKRKITKQTKISLFSYFSSIFVCFAVPLLTWQRASTVNCGAIGAVRPSDIGEKINLLTKI